jgi:hypothetical protein
MAVAEPIASAMSALHRVEASHGAAQAEAGPAALVAARQALAMLQQQPPGYPAVDQALEAIAGSLNLIHQLAQAPAAAAQPNPAFAGTMAMPPGAAPAQPPQGWGQQPQQPPAYPPQPGHYQQPAPGYPQGAPPQYQPPAAPGYPQGAPPQYQQPAPGYQQPAPGYQQPAPGYQQPPAYQPPPAAAPAPAAYQAPPAAAPAAAAAPSPSPNAYAPPPQPTGGNAPLRVEAELGAHSTTNFYKGLSGNDVIDSGGIFVATYQLPKIGQNVVVRVSMPGGYEFEALAVVRWTRESALSGSDSPPGFGAQFTQISPEGRQLVYRYVRNREPLFHDDL